MGSSDEPNSNSKTIDASVGGLVWVRRRNGSWWPGRIMVLTRFRRVVWFLQDQALPLNSSAERMPAWTGIILKNLRGEGISMWGIDECIEKAKANAANGNKKTVKYARREDAILHALEIENARLGKDRVDFFSRTNNSGGELGSSAKELPSMSGSGKEDVDMTEERKEKKNPNDSEDDGTEGIKRMRGLEDLGIVVGDSNAVNCLSNGSPINGSKGYSSMKRKRSQVANVHEFLKRKNRRRPLTKVLECTAMVSVPVICDQLPNSSGSPLNGLSDSKVSGIDSNECRKNISVVVNNNSESTGISCDNGASLNPIEHAYDASHINSKLKKESDVPVVSEFVENDSSDKLFDVPFGEEKHSAGIHEMITCKFTVYNFRSLGMSSWFVSYVCVFLRKASSWCIGEASSQSSQAEAVSLKNEVLNESGSTSSAATHVNNISQRIEKATECSIGSLMSKLNGKAIVGRPLTVEVLDDGYCDLIMSSNECDPTHAPALEAAELRHAAMQNSESGRITAKHMTMQRIFHQGRSVSYGNSTWAVDMGDSEEEQLILVKQFGRGSAGIQFSKESNNLYNLNSYKHSGLANKKTVSIQPGKDQSVVLATTKTKKQNKPAALLHKSVMKKEFRRMTKAVETRPDLKKAALARLSVVHRSLKVAKSGVKKRNRQVQRLSIRK
ncbi:hypothetical protein GH714_035955 [Hevea brasiliensis]|uniref:PWWP domain-containing protein n=1 Tax=Hevea brasiliensis TaxID=3981 RepID=A0A6A6NEG9_HEVBR|nr:hypothetical protein GH714_035955 [Hevea brasiliensis]